MKVSLMANPYSLLNLKYFHRVHCIVLELTLAEQAGQALSTFQASPTYLEGKIHGQEACLTFRSVPFQVHVHRHREMLHNQFQHVGCSSHSFKQRSPLRSAYRQHRERASAALSQCQALRITPTGPKLTVSLKPQR